MAVWRRYNLSSGDVTEAGQQRRKGPAIHRRFQPFLSPQVHPKTAKDLGLKQKGKMTVFEREADLNRYQAYERDHGREVGWRDF